MRKRRLSFGFIFNNSVEIPTNLREYYVSIELLSRGHRVVWFCAEKANNYRFSRTPPVVCIRSKGRGKVNGFLYPFYLAYVLFRRKIRCVWVSGWGERSAHRLFFLIAILRLLAFKVVYDPIDPIYEYVLSIGRKLTKKQERKLRFFTNAIYKISNITLTVTEELKDLLIRKGAPAQKVHVAWWGTDIERFTPNRTYRPLREEYGLQEKFVVGWLGTMSPFKGIEDILIPLIKMLPRFIDDVFFLIGGKGILEERFISLSEEHASLLMLGRVPYELAPSFSAALDLYLIPLSPETELGRCTRPIKMFDALAVGTPILITATKATMAMSSTFRSIQYAADLNDFFQAILYTYKNYGKIKRLALSETGKASSFSHQEVSVHVAGLLEKELTSKYL